MLLRIPAIAQKPPAARLGPDSHDDHRDGQERRLESPALPHEVLTLSDAAHHGLTNHARQPRQRDAAFDSDEEAAAAAGRLERWIRTNASRAARAQAHASAERVWNLLWD